ncbi:hypothetical protein IFM89_000631 [Coptis chinensis]|uniref:Uncharacterized protein n=1 Tax=Coptis chinensis TaxID=261450 RepID=A0A835HET3_9MAGN|nr:hypothetical protein IFM89_000631 [Coptis chinensis]
MAQLDPMKIYIKSSSGGNKEQTMEQLLRGGDDSWTSRTSSPTFGRHYYDHEEHDHHTKKSVLTKVKEKARKLKHTLSYKKKHSHDDNATPAWGVSLEDDYYDDDGEDADAEYYGAPMYESAKAPEDVKKTAKEHPREDLLISPRKEYVIPSYISPRKEQLQQTSKKVAKSVRTKSMPTRRKETSEIISESVTEKLAPLKTTSNTISESVTERLALKETMNYSKTITESVTEKLAPAYAMASEATGIITSKIHDMAIATSAALSPRESPKCEAGMSEKKYDKGVSVKEYLRQKLEPGEDEKALSQVISEAISPRKKESIKDGKAKGAVSPFHVAAKSSLSLPRNTSSNIPLSTNAYEGIQISVNSFSVST